MSVTESKARPGVGRRMPECLEIGQRWRRLRDGTVWALGQIHRKDRCVCLVHPTAAGAVRVHPSYRELRTQWEPVL